MKRVAYVLARFPVLSESFVSGEVAELERQGVCVDIYSIERGERVEDPGVEALAGRAHYLADLPRAAATLGALARWAAQAGRRGSPRLETVSGARKWLRFLPWAQAILASGASHIHAHFANVPTEIARLLARTTGLPFSFTCHARDVFPPSTSLGAWAAEASSVVTVCEYNRRHLVGCLPGIPPEKIRVVVCGVDPGRFARGRPYAARPFRILAVGRLVEKKGFVHLVRALAHLRDRAIPFECRIVGEGGLRGALEREIAGADLSGIIRLEGEMKRERVKEALEEASVLVMPAIVAVDGDRDSMPVVVKEAMAMEVPVVGSSEVGIPEMVSDETGWLVPPGDEDALAEAIEGAWRTDPAKLAAMGRRGRRVVLERFTLRAEVTKLARIFEGGAR